LTARDEAVLGRVTDPTALDDERGAVGEYETFAPRAWCGRRARLELPRNVRCRTCSGGGCDRCERSGAYRLASDPAGRTIELDLPAASKVRVAVRVPHPFGDASPLKQLIVLVEERADPDPRLHALDDHRAALEVRSDADPPRSWIWVGVAAAVALVAALARLLAG
jgi:hypothetical protein